MFTGEASIIYMYLWLYKIIGDVNYLIYAGKHADKMMEEDPSRTAEDDLLSGKAGVIIAYLEVYKYTGRIKYFDFAVSIADVLFTCV